MLRKNIIHVCLAGVFALATTSTLLGQGSIINGDISGVDRIYQGEVAATIDRFTNEIANDFSEDLPLELLARLNPVQVTITSADIDGEGGVLADAATIEYATLETRYHSYAVAQSANIRIDTSDQDALFAAGDFQNVVLHELMHGMGFQGTAWTMNGLVEERAPLAYLGNEGLRAFREESGIRTATFIPLEGQGGAGSAGSHLSSLISFFYRNRRAPIMGAFYDPLLQMFLYNTEIAMMRDVHLAMSLDGWQPPSVPPFVWKDNPYAGPAAIRAVPEPSSAAFFLLAGIGLVARRRRK